MLSLPLKVSRENCVTARPCKGVDLLCNIVIAASIYRVYYCNPFAVFCGILEGIRPLIVFRKVIEIKKNVCEVDIFKKAFIELLRSGKERVLRAGRPLRHKAYRQSVKVRGERGDLLYARL